MINKAGLKARYLQRCQVHRSERAPPPSPCRDPARTEPGATLRPAQQHRARHHRCRPPAGPHRRRQSHRGAAEPQRAGYRRRQSLIPGAGDVAAIPSSDPGPPLGRRRHRTMVQPDQGGPTPSGHAQDAQTGGREWRDRSRPPPRRRSLDLQSDHADRRPISAPNNTRSSVVRWRHIFGVDTWDEGYACSLLPIMWIRRIEDHAFFIALICDVIVPRNVENITRVADISFATARQTEGPFHAVDDLIAGQIPWHGNPIQEVQATAHSIANRTGHKRLDVGLSGLQCV